MAGSSLGLIETVGLAAGIEAADVMLKSANVKLVGYELSKGGGLVTVKITGEVGAVKAAIEAAKASAGKVQRVYSSTVIPRPSGDLDLFNGAESLKKEDSEKETKQAVKPAEKAGSRKTTAKKAQSKKPAETAKAASTSRKPTKRKPAAKPPAKTKAAETKPAPAKTVEAKPAQTKSAPKKPADPVEKTETSTKTETPKKAPTPKKPAPKKTEDKTPVEKSPISQDAPAKASDNQASSEISKPMAKGAETDKKA